MSPMPRPRPSADPTLTVGSVQIVEPTGSKTWCEANQDLFLFLEEPPTKKDPAEHRAAYNEGVLVARDMCSRLCPRFDECLSDAIEGLPQAGFIAGTTEAERTRHRLHLGITGKNEVVTDRAVGITGDRRRSHTDRDIVDESLTRYPTMSKQQIADMLGCSMSTVSRRRRELRQRGLLGGQQPAPEPDAEAADEPAQPTTPAVAHDHTEVYYSLRECDDEQVSATLF